jgi:general secretion pathway protein D
MVRFDNGWRLLLLMILAGTLLLGGCAKYQARSAFQEAEALVAAEAYDKAVEKYFEATQNDPGNTTYKLKLAAGRTRASAFHINKARRLAKEGKVEEALAEYRLARGFDPSLEVAATEAKQLEGLLKARELAEQGITLYGERRYAAARQTLTQTLALDPQNARALELQKLLDAKYRPVVMDGVELDIASDEPVTLKLKQANLKEVFGILGQLSGINFILDDELKEKPITVLLEKGTFSQAMELILQMGGVGKKVLNGKTIIIYPQTKEKAKQYEDQIIQSFYLSHIDAKKAVNLLRTMLQLRKVYVHEERNALVIRDTPDTIKLAERLLLAADRADSEVLFDVEVLAVRDSDALKFGPKLSNYGTTVTFTDAVNAEGNPILTDIFVQSLNNIQTFYTLPSASFDLAKTLSTSELLASPKIRVKNNEKAKVHIGKRDPIVTTTNIGTSDQTTQNVQYVDSGIKLDIEPSVQLDGTVLAKITLEVSNATRLDSRDTTGTSPVALTTTNAQTSLVLIDGTRTILGGLYEVNQSKNKSSFPFLGDIPLIGSLLSSFDNSEEKREIILSITPYIVKKVEVPETDIATIWSGGEEELMNRPKFGAFAQPLLSEVESTRLSAAPAQDRTDRPAPFSALQGQIAPMPIGPEAEQLPATAVPGEGVPTMIPAPPESAQRPTPAAEAPAGLTAASLLALPMPGTGQPGPAAPPAGVAAPRPTPAAVPEFQPTAEMKPGESPIILPPLPKPAPKLSFSGATGAKVGEEIVLVAQVANIEQLYSAPLFVNYDPARLELVTVSEGSFLAQQGQSTVFSHSPNPATGQAVIGYKQGIGGGGASGGGALFSLTFRAKAPGAAQVELNRVNFRDPAGARLAVDPVTVTLDIK